MKEYTKVELKQFNKELKTMTEAQKHQALENLLNEYFNDPEFD